MVSTRNHPRAFPEPTASPTKRDSTPKPESSPSTALARTSKALTTTTRSSTRSSSASSGWTHTPSNLALVWLAVSLPLVIWDTGYVMLRPYSMPGGSLHWPWKPYALYGTVDHVYGFKAYNSRLGFTAAQGTLNIIETLGYLVYLWIVYSAGSDEGDEGRGAPSKDKIGWWGAALTVRGRTAGVATLLGFAVCTMTWSKTVLYWLNEAYSGFEGVGHNSWSRLVFLWILPNLPWIPIPLYMSYVFAAEILEGLAIAAGDTKKAR